MGLGPFGFVDGLGVLVRGWAGSLGDFDLGPKLTRGFHLNGPGEPVQNLSIIRRFWGRRVSLGRFGFAGGLGVLEYGWVWYGTGLGV